MEPYEMSEAFRRLEKLADLEKRVEGNIEDAKDGDNGKYIPDSIRADLKRRGECPVPREVLDETIDDGLDGTIAHLSRHRAMMLPGEALYHAIGQKDSDIYNQAMRFSLKDILSLIVNRAAVSQTQPDTPMKLDEFDVPRHVKLIVRLRGLSPDMLEKSARDVLGTMEMLDGLQLTFSNGRKETVGEKYAKDHKTDIERFINDGTIIKVIKIMSSGLKTTIYDKTASSDVEDMLYAEMMSANDLAQGLS